MKKILSILASAVVLAMPLAVTTAQAASHTGAPMAAPAASKPMADKPMADKPMAKATHKAKHKAHKAKRKAKAAKKAMVETK